MTLSNSKVIILLGFSVQVVVLITLSFIWLASISSNSDNLKEINDSRKKSTYTFQIRDIANLRSLALYRMINIGDSFELNDEIEYFRELGGDFIDAREKLVAMGLAGEELGVWKETQPLIRKSSQLQWKVVDIIKEDRGDDASQLLLNEIIPIQKKVIEKLTFIHNLQTNYVAKLKRDSDISAKNTRFTIALLSGVAILSGILIIMIVIRRITQTESELVDARIKAQLANKHKTEFLSNMSHEIRTPLTAIIGFAETLSDTDQTREERWMASNTIIRNSRHLMNVISNILDLSKIESNKMELDITDVRTLELFSDVESLLGSRARQKGLRFEMNHILPLPEIIRVDSVRLKQVLINLLGNSIKFTESGSISLDVSYDQPNDGLVISVQDTGIGMSDEEQLNIFSPFVQADLSTTRKYGGTGLGLTIARDLVELMGGKLDVTSKRGLGTRIDVYLKNISADNKKILITENKPVSDIAVNADENRLHGHVLLVEDNPDLRKLVSAWIRKTGAEVVVAENGQEALDKTGSHQFDLVFMDMQMPVMGGVEAIKGMRKSGSTTPIIVLSGDESTREGESYQSIGANDYLAKPINQYRLYKMLKKYLEKTDDKMNNARRAV